MPNLWICLNAGPVDIQLNLKPPKATGAMFWSPPEVHLSPAKALHITQPMWALEWPFG